MTSQRLPLGIVFCLLLLLAGGCSQAKPGAPSLRVSYRKASIPGKGLVIGLTNTSSQSLNVDRVHVRSADEKHERPYDQMFKKTIGPNDSIAIGWVELDGWKIRKGDQVRIFFREFEQPFEITVGEETQADD
jgi:hypothetical protein